MKVWTARLAAWISKQLMCQRLSWALQAPTVLTPLDVAPHPRIRLYHYVRVRDLHEALPIPLRQVIYPPLQFLHTLWRQIAWGIVVLVVNAQSQ